MFKYETHLHTAECDLCAHVRAADAVRMYRDAGYSGMVVTDHYFALLQEWFKGDLADDSHKTFIDRWLRGYRAAREEGERLGFTVLLGTEVRFDGPSINDYLVYGLTEEFFYRAPLLNRLTGLDELLSLLPPEALVVQAHPFRDKMTVADPTRLFGIEVHNGGTDEKRNALAALFAAQYGKAPLSGSDFHEAKHLARGGIATETPIKSSADLLSVLKSGAYTLLTK